MLDKLAYENARPGVWDTFERERPRLNLQELEPGFADGTGLAPDELKNGFWALADELKDLSHVIRKARLFEFLMKNGRLAVDPEDWFADKLDTQKLMRDYNNKMMEETTAAHIREARDTLKGGYLTGAFEAYLDLGHVSPGWTLMYENGLKGLVALARKAKDEHGGALTVEQTDFYESMEIVYGAIEAFCLRLAGYADTLAAKETGPALARLRSVADSLRHVPANSPRDLHEALQFTYIMHQAIEMEGEQVRSMSGFDRHFFKYYDADIKSGRLTVANAKELIKFFFTKFFAHTRGASNGKNFYFGGQYRDGSNAENELTYTALEAYYEMNTTDPKLSVRFHKSSSDRLYRQVAETIRDGRTAFVLVNDEVAIPAIMTQGKTLEEARDYVLIGCYEPAIEGREIACNMSAMVNMAKAVELVFNRGVDKSAGTVYGSDTGNPIDFTSYEQFEEAFFAQLYSIIDRVTWAVKSYEPYWPVINPSPVLGGTFIDGIEKGRDIGQCGPKYNNTGCMGAGLASAADSLLAVKDAVFEQKICTMAELMKAMDDNFKGHEKLRLYLRNRPLKWGNAQKDADAIAKKIAENYAAYVNFIENKRGGRFVPSMFSLAHRYSMGKGTAALPDGRLSGEPISLNNAAEAGMDKEGVTALIKSLTSIDYSKIPNGSVTDIYLHPSAVAGDDGLSALIAIIKTYFRLGGYGIQFNIFDTETLLDAQKHPEKYQTLQVRVCGWNVYFVTMSQKEQEQYINMNKHVV